MSRNGEVRFGAWCPHGDHVNAWRRIGALRSAALAAFAGVFSPSAFAGVSSLTTAFLSGLLLPVAMMAAA